MVCHVLSDFWARDVDIKSSRPLYPRDGYIRCIIYAPPVEVVVSALSMTSRRLAHSEIARTTATRAKSGSMWSALWHSCQRVSRSLDSTHSLSNVLFF